MRSILMVLAIVLGACGDGGDDDDDAGGPDGGPGLDAGPGPDCGAPPEPGEPVTLGRVHVHEDHAPWQSRAAIRGDFAAGGPVVWQVETMREGDCRLLELEGASGECGYCETVCIGGVCQPLPDPLSAGEIAITGTKTPVALQYDYGFYYLYELVEDLFDEGDVIGVAAAGDEVPAFTLEAVAPPALESVELDDEEILLSDDEDFVFRWSPAGCGARVRLTLNANNAGHGLPYAAILECDAPDTGELTIAQALILGFPTTYRWEACAGSDCPLSSFARYTRDEVELAGGSVELVVGSRIQFWVRHREEPEL